MIAFNPRIALHHHIHFLTKQTKTKVMNVSYPRQPPTTADKAINAEAEGNLPAGDDFAQPSLNAEGSDPASNDPAQHPALPPFVEHATNDAVNPPVPDGNNKDSTVDDYHIDGVA